MQNYTPMEIGQYAEVDGQYVFCQMTEEAEANHERYNQGLLTYKEVPVVRGTKHIELVYKDETMEEFKSQLGEIGDLDYHAMTAALAAEEKKTADQMFSQVNARISAPAINYDKVRSILAAEERKTTNYIVSHVLAGIQQPAIDYGKLASFLAAEDKKSTDQIISKAVGSIQQPTIDYDKLVIAFDSHSDGANVDAGPGLICVISLLLLILTVFGSLIMAIKGAGQETKKYTDALEKILTKCGASTDEDEVGLTEKEIKAGSSKETSREKSEDNGDSDDHEEIDESDDQKGSDESEDSEDNEDSDDDAEMKNIAATNITNSVPTFTEYVHGKAKLHSSTPEPTATPGPTVSLDKAKVVTDDLSGFKNPAERELVEDMLLDATLDIMEFGDRVPSQERDALRAPEARKRGLDLVDKICVKGKQYTDKAKRVTGVISSNTHALERKYKETLDKGYNSGPSALKRCCGEA